MSPLRSPSPFETSEPGDALLASSISLEGSAVAVRVPGPIIASKPSNGEIILLKTEHMCPSEVNGKGRCRACYEKAAELLRRLGFIGGGVKAVTAGVQAMEAAVEAEISLPEDDSISAIPEGGVGTLSLSTKKAIFDEALFGLESMSGSLYIKAVADREAEESFDEVMRWVDGLGLFLSEAGDGEGVAYDHTEDGESGQRSGGYILLDVHNTDLGGDGQAYLHMQDLEENEGGHQGDIEVCYTGSGF